MKTETKNAKSLIEKAIEDWINNDQEEKVVSLGEFVKRWNSKGGGPKTKYGSIKKDIKNIELNIKRYKSRGRDISLLEKELGDLKVEREELKEKYNFE